MYLFLVFASYFLFSPCQLKSPKIFNMTESQRRVGSTRDSAYRMISWCMGRCVPISGENFIFVFVPIGSSDLLHPCCIRHNIKGVEALGTEMFAIEWTTFSITHPLEHGE